MTTRERVKGRVIDAAWWPTGHADHEYPAMTVEMANGTLLFGRVPKPVMDACSGEPSRVVGKVVTFTATITDGGFSRPTNATIESEAAR